MAARLIISIGLQLYCSVTFAQWQPLRNIEDVVLSYRVVNKDGVSTLYLEVDNLNAVAVDCEFQLVVMNDALVLEDLGSVSVCIDAKKSLKSKADGLMFELKNPLLYHHRVDCRNLSIQKADRTKCRL